MWEGNQLKAVGELVPNNLYRMNFAEEPESINIVDVVPENVSQMWHNRLGHAAISIINRAIKRGQPKGTDKGY